MRAEHEHGGRDARTAGRGHRSIDVDPGGPEFGRERGAALPGAVVMKESGIRKVARARNVARRDAGAMFGLVAAEAGGCARVDHLLRRMVEIGAHGIDRAQVGARSEEHTSELQSLMRISYAVFCLKKKKTDNTTA